MNSEITHASDKTSRFGMAHESQSLEVEILESPAPAENEARLSVLARRAGGPRTPKGKARTKHNALKHGLFSKVVLLKNEPRAEFESLLNGLRSDLQPVGTLEIVFVDKLAALLWRQRRLLIAEGAEIQKGREFSECDKYQHDEAAAEDALLRCSLPYSMGLIRQISNPVVLQRCLDLLEELKTRIKSDDFDHEWNRTILTQIYGTSRTECSQIDILIFYLSCFPKALETLGPDVRVLPQDSASLEKSKNRFLEGLEAEIERLNLYKSERALIESTRLKLASLSRGVPDAMQMDRLLRYAASLDRDVDRLLKQLERLQRMRLGQPLPPPVDVNVSLEQ